MIAYGSTSGRWIIGAAVGGSALVMIDATVVNVALPRMGADLGGGISAIQWVVTGYLLTLSALILLGGGLGDLYGRRRIFIVGAVGFAAASLLCGLAPDATTLVAARALQGVAGALLTPASLAIIQSSFRAEDRGAAIGAWSGLGGVAAAVGPFVGGWLVEAVSWRAIFLVNIPVAAAVVLAARRVPESSDPERRGWHPDLAGGLLAALALGGTTYALIESPERGWSSAAVLTALAAAAVAAVAFLLVEVRDPHAMLPLRVFASRRFSGANASTFAVYAALGGFFFLLAIHLQGSLEYSPLEAGAAGLPVTLVMLAFSARAGRLSQRIGPRVPMTLGPFVMAVGLVLARRIVPGVGYLDGVLPATAVFAAGLVLTVAPLTTTVLDAAEPRLAGVASGVNNAVARAAGLFAVAIIPVVAGLTGELGVGELTRGFRAASVYGAAAVATGGVIAWLTVGDRRPTASAAAEELHCSVTAPPLRPADPEWGCPGAVTP